MRKIQRVGIDLDGTTVDYIHGIAPLLKEHYGLEPDFSKPVMRIEEVFGLTRETRPPRMREHLYDDLHGFRSLPPLEPDIGNLSWELFQLEQRTEIYIITARHPSETIVDDTLTWLDKHNFIYTDVFFTEDKALLCETMGISVMFEDEPLQTRQLTSHNIPVVMRNQPWNSSVDDHPLIRRADDWKGMLEAAKEYLL
jgi:uncharacterized HAD superfamily protein